MKSHALPSTAAMCLFLLSTTAFAGLPLETETARLLKPRQMKMEATFEFQTSAQGTETAIPILIEYGIGSRLELAVEPVLHANVRPKSGRHAGGAGDMEATLTWLLASEGQGRPALALAFEVKFPTARDPMLGTKHTDYAGYVIASRRIGRVDLHGNLGYTVLGKPPDLHLRNIFSFAAAMEYHVSRRWDLVGEAFANTTAVPGLGEGDSQSNPNVQTAELAGGEVFGMVGSRWHAGEKVTLSLGIVYDNNSALLIRPGISLRF